MLQLVEKRKGMEAVLKPGPTRTAGTSSRLLEDILRWGTATLFKEKPQQHELGLLPMAEAAAALAAADEAKEQQGAEGQQEQQAEGMDVDGAAGAQQQQPGVYDDQQLQLLVARATDACAAEPGAAKAAAGGEAGEAEAVAEVAGSSCSGLAEGLESVVVREWSDVQRSVVDDAAGALCLAEQFTCLMPAASWYKSHVLLDMKHAAWRMVAWCPQLACLTAASPISPRCLLMQCCNTNGRSMPLTVLLATAAPQSTMRRRRSSSRVRRRPSRRLRRAQQPSRAATATWRPPASGRACCAAAGSSCRLRMRRLLCTGSAGTVIVSVMTC